MDESPYKTEPFAYADLPGKVTDYYWWQLVFFPGRGLVWQIIDGKKVLGEGSTPWDARIAAGISPREPEEKPPINPSRR